MPQGVVPYFLVTLFYVRGKLMPSRETLVTAPATGVTTPAEVTVTYPKAPLDDTAKVLV